MISTEPDFDYAFLAAGSHQVTLRVQASDSEWSDTKTLTVDLDPGMALRQTSLISKGSTWNYLVTNEDPGSAWKEPGFGWTTSGPAELGYGDEDEATKVGFGGDPKRLLVKHAVCQNRRSF